MGTLSQLGKIFKASSTSVISSQLPRQMECAPTSRYHFGSLSLQNAMDVIGHIYVGKETSRMDYATRYSREDENNMLNSLAHSFSVLREKCNTVFRPAKTTLKFN